MPKSQEKYYSRYTMKLKIKWINIKFVSYIKLYKIIQHLKKYFKSSRVAEYKRSAVFATLSVF